MPVSSGAEEPLEEWTILETKERRRRIHMKKNRWVLRMMVLLVISGMMSMTVSLAAEAGSSQDPLVLSLIHI